MTYLATSPPRNDPARPISAVRIRPIGLGPGTSRRPSPPMISPPIASQISKMSMPHCTGCRLHRSELGRPRAHDPGGAGGDLAPGFTRARTGYLRNSEGSRMNAHASASAAGTIGLGGDLTVSRMGFGAMRITGSGIWGEPPDRQRARQTLRRVVELGVTFIVTADSYGPEVSETLIAEALHPYPENLVIATKGGLLRPGPGRWEPDGRPAHLREACEGSLRRLRLEQIPLYQFHRPDPKVPLGESIGALVELKQHGKIRHIGVSNVTEEQLRTAQRLTPVVSVQNRYNAADRRSDSMVDLCEQEQIAFLPWAPVQDLDGNVPVAAAARRHGVTPHQVVLAWLLARSPAMLPIPGTGSPEHAEENIAAASIELTPDEVAAIGERAGELPDE